MREMSIIPDSMNNYQVCKSNINRYVKLTLVDGRIYRGYIVEVDNQNVKIAIPGDTSGVDVQSHGTDQERWFPFWPVAIPLLFIAAVARRRPRYPYPPYYYPYPPYPYLPY